MSYEPTTPRWVKITKTFTDFSAATTSNDIEIYDLAANEVLLNAQINTTAVIESLTALSIATVSVGISGTLNKYMLDTDAMTTAQTENSIAKYTPESYSTNTSIRAQLTIDSGRLDSLNAGSIDFYLLISALPA